MKKKGNKKIHTPKEREQEDPYTKTESHWGKRQPVQLAMFYWPLLSIANRLCKTIKCICSPLVNRVNCSN